MWHIYIFIYCVWNTLNLQKSLRRFSGWTVIKRSSKAFLESTGRLLQLSLVTCTGESYWVANIYSPNTAAVRMFSVTAVSVCLLQSAEVRRPEPDVHQEPVAALCPQSFPDRWEGWTWGEDCGGLDRQLSVCLWCEYTRQETTVNVVL